MLPGAGPWNYQQSGKPLSSEFGRSTPIAMSLRCTALPIVSIVVPFFGYPFLWLGPYNRDFGQPKKGTTMETLGRA